MEPKKQTYYLATIFYQDETLFLVPENELEGKAHFPVLRFAAKPSKDDIEILLRQYKIELEDGELIEPLVIEREGETKTYHIFWQALPEYWKGVYTPLEYDGFEKLGLNSLDEDVAERFFYFYPLMSGRNRQIPLEPEEKAKVKLYQACLNYYAKRMPKQLREDFDALVEAPSSPTRIKKAFDYLCRRYGFSLQGYKRARLEEQD